MADKIRLSQAILVEGRYDKVKLDSVIDGLIIPVHGFSVFTDFALSDLIKKLAKERGIIIIMDSDAAGFKIRGFIRGLVPQNQRIDVYIPDIMGKEKRKRVSSKEGKLGVEGMTIETIRRVLADAGVVMTDKTAKTEPITQQDFIKYGLSGGNNSGLVRKKIYKKLALPERLTTKAAIPLLNSMMSREEFLELVNEIQ